MIPQNFKLQYPRQEIVKAVERMGSEISDWANEVWKSSHTDLLALPVLRGGIFFFADLVREISTSVEIDSIRTWSYSSSENATQLDDIKVNLEDIPAKGRHILLIDDICDSGQTLKVLSQMLKDEGALEVRSAVLVKRVLDEETFDPDWIGFEYHGP